MALFGSLFPLACWFIYAFLAARMEAHHPSLSMIMSSQRRRWVDNAVRRDTPIDAILSSNLMGSVSFFASTTVLIILALFAVFGQIGPVVAAIAEIEPDRAITAVDIERHLAVLVVMFGAAFLSFTLSLRQFNHFCIMLGAADHSEDADPAEVRIITALNTLGARNFNQGIRMYYMAIGMVAWFVSPLIGILATCVVLAAIFYREFFSSARNLVAGLEDK